MRLRRAALLDTATDYYARGFNGAAVVRLRRVLAAVKVSPTLICASTEPQS